MTQEDLHRVVHEEGEHMDADDAKMGIDPVKPVANPES